MTSREQRRLVKKVYGSLTMARATAKHECSKARAIIRALVVSKGA